ncbi:hypothetical protein V8G54_022563 [Vigna mungo]|uniref:Uncharacterized protein n=1 Tax=Vigna mungo TaxID=3915 RepID=A0AAQ3RPH7_VIGMU
MSCHVPLLLPEFPLTQSKTTISFSTTKTRLHLLQKNVKTKKKKKKRRARKRRDFFPFNSCSKDTNFGGYWWYSSDENDETDTLFFSKSLSSDSSRSRRRGWKNDRSSGMGALLLHGKVKDTFAVVKRSSDPYR